MGIKHIPSANPDASLNLIQLAIQVDGEPTHGREEAAREVLSNDSEAPRFMAIGGVRSSDGLASILKLTDDGKLEVNTTVTMGDVKVGSTDGVNLNAGIKVNSLWQIETVSSVAFVGPATILSGSEIAAGLYNSASVDTRQFGTQCFSLNISSLDLGETGSMNVRFQWSMDNVNFYDFTDGVVPVTVDDDIVINYDFKVPYVRAQKEIIGGIDSGTIVVKHFSNAL